MLKERDEIAEILGGQAGFKALWHEGQFGGFDVPDLVARQNDADAERLEEGDELGGLFLEDAAEDVIGCGFDMVPKVGGIDGHVRIENMGDEILDAAMAEAGQIGADVMAEVTSDMAGGAGKFEDGSSAVGIAPGRKFGEPLIDLFLSVAVFLVPDESGGPLMDVGRAPTQQAPALFEVKVEFTEAKAPVLDGVEQMVMIRATLEKVRDDPGPEGGGQGAPLLDEPVGDGRMLELGEGLEGGLLKFERLKRGQECDQRFEDRLGFAQSAQSGGSDTAIERQGAVGGLACNALEGGPLGWRRGQSKKALDLPVLGLERERGVVGEGFERGLE